MGGMTLSRTSVEPTCDLSKKEVVELSLGHSQTQASKEK